MDPKLLEEAIKDRLNDSSEKAEKDSDNSKFKI
jgi:hypothetical protein